MLFDIGDPTIDSWTMVPRKRQRVSYFDDPILLGRRLRETREAAGMSQRELSFPGCTAAYISRIEKGERVPSLQLIREFASRLGVTEEYIAHGSHAPKHPGSSFVEGRVAVRMGDLEVARSLADGMLGGARSDGDRARASALVGEIALFDGNAGAAVDALERARLLDASFEASDPTFAEMLGRAYAGTMHYEMAVAVFMRNRDRAAASGDAVNEVRFTTLLARAYADSGNSTAADDALSRVLELGVALTDPIDRARSLWAQSRAHAKQNEPTAASSYAARALDVLDVSEQSLHIGVAYLLLAHIEIDRGHADRALELLEHGEAPIAASGRRFERALARIEHARALVQARRRDEASAGALEAAAALAEVEGVEAGRGYILLAGLFESLGDEERALELYELAVAKLPPRNAAEAYSRYAALLEKRGDKDAALEVLKRAMEASTETRSRP